MDKNSKVDAPGRLNIGNFKRILDIYFKPPHISEGLIKTRWSKWDGELALEIQIDGRDVMITQNGQVVASGTSLCTN